MRSLPIGRLAAWQCLLLSLFVSLVHRASSWVPSPVIRSHGRNVDSSRKPTSLASGDGVMDFVKGLDSALGNPTASSAAQAASKAPVVASSAVAAQSSGAVTMNVPNSVILAGGGVAFLAFLGLAFFFVSRKDDDFFDDLDVKSGLDTSFGIEDVTPLPKKIPDANAIGDQIKAAETKFQEQQQEAKPTPSPSPPPPPPPPVVEAEKKAPEPSTIVDDSSGGSLLSKLKAKLARKTEELEENQELLSNETDLRKETESKLDAANTENEGLTEQLASKEQALVETTEKWNYTKSKLQEELKLKETLEAELKVAAEENRVLEDKFELGQNSLMKTRNDLKESKESLEATRNRLTRTQGELSRIHTRLQVTQKVLDETTEELERLEDEQKSLRVLGGKMWNLSKSRVKNRVRSVGDRLRGRGPKKNKKKAKRF